MVPISTSSGKEWLSHPDTLWIEHTEQVERYALLFARSLPKTISAPVSFEIFVELNRWIALFHDLGKTTRYFQEYIRSEDKLQTEYNRHALLSALVGYWAIYHWLQQQRPAVEHPEILAFLAFMVIRYHHGNLRNPFQAYTISSAQCDILREQWQSIARELLEQFWEAKRIPLKLAEIDTRIQELPGSFRIKRQVVRFFRKRSDYDYYFLTNTLFSILLDADKSAAGLHKQPEPQHTLAPDVVDYFRAVQGWNQPRSNFDRLRSSAYQEAIQYIVGQPDSRILTLQIPTGFGKTLTAISAAAKLRHQHRLQRIIYCLPFTAIIDQNYQEIRQVLETYYNGSIDHTLLLKHHHLSDIFYQERAEAYTTPESELLMEGWNSQLIITTFVQFFHTLVGYRNRALRKFHRLANSVIILDEVQTIPFKYWDLLNYLLLHLSEKFNSYLILVTATQPHIFETRRLFSLVDGKPYFESTNRVRLHVHIDQRYTLEEFLPEVLEKSQGKQRVMVVLNTIKSAQEFYQKLRAHFDCVHFLSSHIVPRERLARIHQLNQSRQYVLVTTQIIEAGVNLDAEIVFRDWAPLDSINQVAGRCNRFAQSCTGEVHLYKLINTNGRLFAQYIYDVVLLNKTEESIAGATTYQETQFLTLIDAYFSRTQALPKNESTRLLESIANLRYSDDDRAIEHFRLIEQNYEKQDVFIELDEEAREVWNEYVALREIKDYWERRKRYLNLRSQLQNYIISVGQRDLRQNPPPVVNGVFYVAHDQLEEYYDRATGYKRISETSIW